MRTDALLVELLLSGFFAVACFKARASFPSAQELRPKEFFYLTNRLERLRRTRWQWCSMVVLLVLARLQTQTPIVAELTALAQFVLFLALPTQKHPTEVCLRS
jgi:hypothetical protein